MKKIALFLILVFVIGAAAIVPGNSTNENGGIALAAVGDSVTVTAAIEPSVAAQNVSWTIAIDEDKMTSFVVRHLKDHEISEYLQLTVVDGASVTVIALGYFKYGIKYTTYYTLTATVAENEELTATCSIKLG